MTRTRLAAVNFLLAGVGITQVSRILLWQRSVKDGSMQGIAEEYAKDVAERAEGVVKDPQKALKKVEAEIK